MKIVSETPTVLTAKDNAISALIATPVMVVMGLVLIGVGLSSSKNFVAAIFGVVLVGIGILLLVNRKVRTLTIDKGASTVILHVSSIRKKQDLRYQVQDVVKMQLVSEYHTTRTNNGGGGQGLTLGGGNTNTTQQTQLLLLMRDGTNIDIADGQRSMGTMSLVSKVPNQQVGEHIAAFLGVQLEVVGPNMPTLGSVVSGVEGLMHHNDAEPSVVPAAPATPAAPSQSSTPTPPVGPDAPGFAMPHATPIVPAAAVVAPAESSTPPAATPTDPATDSPSDTDTPLGSS
jgi:hypothetical protein